jgi:hypothetical protein
LSQRKWCSALPKVYRRSNTQEGAACLLNFKKAQLLLVCEYILD